MHVQDFFIYWDWLEIYYGIHYSTFVSNLSNQYFQPNKNREPHTFSAIIYVNLGQQIGFRMGNISAYHMFSRISQISNNCIYDYS